MLSLCYRFSVFRLKQKARNVADAYKIV